MGMHVPWIQVTQEAWDLANQFAGLTGLSFQEAFTGLIEAWRWGVGLGPETEPPKGICDSPRALDRLASVMRLLKMDRQTLVDALVELEVIEPRPSGGLRVRGTRRYWPAWAKNNPDLWKVWKAANPDEFPGAEPKPAGPEPEPIRTRPGTEPSPAENRTVSAPQTQTQTQEKKPLTHARELEKLTAPPVVRPAPGAADLLREAWATEFERATGKPYRIGDSFKDAQAQMTLLSWPEATPEEVARRSAAALADEWFRKRASLPLLVQQWNQHRGQDAPPPDTRPPCANCGEVVTTVDIRGRRLCYPCAAAAQLSGAA